ISGLIFHGSDATDDTLTIDLARGDVPLSVEFHGGAGGFDSLILHGATSGSYTPGQVYGDGVIQSGQTSVSFTGLEPVYVNGATVTGTPPGGLTVANPSFTFVTPGGVDDISIDRVGADVGPDQLRISGTSGGTAFEYIVFKNIQTVTINTGTNDTTGSWNDKVTVNAALFATGLQNLIINTGNGDDTVDLKKMAGNNAVTVTVDLGTGANTLIGPEVGGTWTVTGAGAGNLKAGQASTGLVNFSNVQNITTGAGSDNTFVFKPGGSLAGTLTGDPENADTILVELQAGPISKSVTFTAITDTSNGSITVDSATVVSYVGIRNPSNLQVLTTSSADVMNLRRTAANTVTLKSTNTTFADVTIVGLSDSLTIRAGLGNDELTVDPQIFGADTGFIFDGQDGTDSLVMAAGTSVTGLTDGSSYVVIPHLTDPKKLQLALASSPTTPIDLTAAGLGAEHYLLLGSANSFIVPPIGFTDDTLVFATAHGFTTGQAVIYDNGGNRSIGPLVSGTVYYAVVLSATTLQLALTSEYALCATPDTIKLTDSGLSLPSTTHTLQAALVFDPLLGVDLASNTITFATNHGITLTPPVSVRYRAGAKFDFAMYVASSDNSGLVSRDDMGVQYIRVESVEDRSVANERVVRLPHANNIAQVTKVGSQIQVTSPADDFVDFKLEEPINYLGLELLGGSNTVIVDMFTPVGALGFEINGRPAGIADVPDVG
ncbi:MAG TPA: hypothetical protein VK968_10605, partial [Roseimicrobium sp.]|nr:hypothetical protein [Roseimicrobium sp.]